MREQDKIKNAIAKLDRQIRDLKEDKKGLEEQLLKITSSFEEKFKIWYENDEKCHHGYIPSGCPLFGKMIDKSCENRYRTYYLEYFFEEVLYAMYNQKEFIENSSEEEYNALIKKYQPVLEEVMTKKIKSFELDW